MRIACLSCLVLLMIACQSQNEKANSIKELRAVEKAFCAYAQKAGLKHAFLKFADSNASIVRNNTVITGKEAISRYFEQGDFSNVTLKWKPDFIDVSASGDLGYTYGTFEWSVTDPDGKLSVQKGIFHTVWKRQEDGSWKFVYD